MPDDQPQSHVTCPNCGYAIPIGATWCEGCGAGYSETRIDSPIKGKYPIDQGWLAVAFIIAPLAICGGCVIGNRLDVLIYSVALAALSFIVGFVLIIVNIASGRK